MTLDEQQALIDVYRKGHQSRIAPFMEAALTHWPALIDDHRKALALLKDLADDLEAEINARYRDDQGNAHPAMQHKYERDMSNVREARKLLEGK